MNSDDRNPLLPRLFDHLATAVAGLAVGVGLLVLAGWALDLALLKSVYPGWVAMKANTALAFILTGIALRLSYADARDALSRSLFRACAGGALLLGLLNCGEYLSGIDFGIDQLLVRDLTFLPGDIPGRMAVATAAGFVALNVALLLVAHPRNRDFIPAIQVLAFVPSLVAAAALIGYVYDVQTFYQVQRTASPMAANTAAVFLLLGLGILCARPDYPFPRILTSDSDAGRTARFLLPVSVGLPPVLGWLVLKGLQGGQFGEIYAMVLFAVGSIGCMLVMFIWNASVLGSNESRRREMEQTLRRSEALLNRILDLLPVGVFICDATGKFARINPAGREIWAGARHAEGVEPSGEYQGWWPDSGRRLAADDWALARTLKSGEVIRDELVDIRCFDGNRKTIANNAAPLCDELGRIIGGVAVHIDVTEFKRTERRLVAAARFDETQAGALALFSASFERQKILDGLLALLAERHPFPAAALYGYDEWSGRFRREAVHGLGGDAPREFDLGEGLLGLAAQAGKPIVLDSAGLTLQTGLADFAPARVLMLPVSYQDKRLAVLVLASSRAADDEESAFLERLAVQLGVALHNLRQYADLKLLAERLRFSSEEIAAKNRQLEEASRMKSEFLANMSHELRTPLNAIIGFAEVLKDGLMGELSARQTEYVGDIFNSGNHLLALINDVLDLSKVEAGRMTLELEPLRVATLVNSSLQIVREKALLQRLKLGADLGGEAGEIWLDGRKARQILYNLLSNAVKFTPEGGEVRLTARRVDRAAVKDGGFDDYLEIVVSDTGIGISTEDQVRLFQPFIQIDSTLARRYEGTGLGLVMVKRLAELHGGAVALASAPGQGSTFTVWLPWRTTGEAPAPVAPMAAVTLAEAAAVAVSARAAGPLAAPLVLVVEDDDPAAELLRVQLEDAGFRVLRAMSGEQALDMAARETPDLVTLDIVLPGMDGWQLLERMQRDATLASVPVVIVSIVADRGRGLSLGAAQVLQKPIAREDLLAAIATIGFPAQDAGKCSVLVIDDDPRAVQLIGAYLAGAGYPVLAAFGGGEGIELARSRHPSLIILDLMMPELGGFDVVEALKADAATAGIPIIVVTSKQITAEDRSRLNGDVRKIVEKSTFNHGRFIGEVKRALRGGGK